MANIIDQLRIGFNNPGTGNTFLAPEELNLPHIDTIVNLPIPNAFFRELGHYFRSTRADADAFHRLSSRISHYYQNRSPNEQNVWRTFLNLLRHDMQDLNSMTPTSFSSYLGPREVPDVLGISPTLARLIAPLREEDIDDEVPSECSADDFSAEDALSSSETPAPENTPPLPPPINAFQD